MKHKLAIPVSGRLSEGRYRTLRDWCVGTCRKQSEVVSMVLDRALEIVEQDGKRQAVEDFVQRLHADPPI